MKILIFGGTGFVGINIANALLTVANALLTIANGLLLIRQREVTRRQIARRRQGGDDLGVRRRA